MTDVDKSLIEQARASLDERSEKLEPHLALRLRAARNQALEAGQQADQRGWMPAMIGATFAMVMVVGMWLGNISEQQNVSIAKLDFEQGFVSRPADLEMLMVADGLELFRELDFYYWLEQKERRAG